MKSHSILALAALALCQSGSMALSQQAPCTVIPESYQLAMTPPPVITATDLNSRTKPGRAVFINLTVSPEAWYHPVNYTIVTQPAHGTLTDYSFIAWNQAASARTTAIDILPPIWIGGSGYFQYQPDAGFVGTDTFTFKGANSAHVSNVATVTITVTDENLPPVATAQDLSVKLGGKIWIYLSGTDPDNDDLTYSVASQPSKGTLRVPTPDDFGWVAGTGPGVPIAVSNNTSGTDVVIDDPIVIDPFDPMPGLFIYEPTVPDTLVTIEDWSDTDSFTFTANDGLADSEEATISLTIKPANRAPVAAIAVSPAAEAWTSAGKTTIVAGSPKRANIFLDAQSSTDADGDSLFASWVLLKPSKGKPSPNVRLAPVEEPIAWGLTAEATLPLGEHQVVGIVTDGEAESRAQVTIKVISAADAVGRVSKAVRDFGAPGRYRAKLTTPLNRAADHCRRGRMLKAIEQLEAFKAAVTANVTGRHAATATQLNDLADLVIEALTPPPVIAY